MSTMRRPACAHMRGWPASAAGIDEAPGSVRPSASAIAIMVAAVPMVMQVPNERAMPFSISSQSSSVILPARFSSQYFHTSEPEPSVCPRQLPRSIGPAGQIDRRQAHGDRAHDQPRRGLVAAAEQHRAVDRVRAQQLLGLHRQEVAIEHGRRLDERLGQRDRRQLERKAAGLQHAALHVLGARAQMRVAGVDVAPGVDDADHRLAAPVVGVVADLAQPRAMPERAQVLHAEPAMRAQVLRASCDRRHASRICAGRRRRQRRPTPASSTRDAQNTGSASTAAVRCQADDDRPRTSGATSRSAATMATPRCQCGIAPKQIAVQSGRKQHDADARQRRSARRSSASRRSSAAPARRRT